MAHPKRQFDLKEVKRLAALHADPSDVAKALGFSHITSLTPYLRADEAVAEAYNAGRTKGGFAPYRKRGYAANGNGNGGAAGPRSQLEQLTQEVFDVIKLIKDGISLGDIEISTGRSTLEVSNAIRTLARHELIRSDGAKYFAAAGPGDQLPQPATKAPRTDTPPPQIRCHKTRRARQRRRSEGRGIHRRPFSDSSVGQGVGAGAGGVAVRAGAW